MARYYHFKIFVLQAKPQILKIDWVHLSRLRTLANEVISKFSITSFSAAHRRNAQQRWEGAIAQLSLAPLPSNAFPSDGNSFSTQIRQLTREQTSVTPSRIRFDDDVNDDKNDVNNDNNGNDKTVWDAFWAEFLRAIKPYLKTNLRHKPDLGWKLFWSFEAVTRKFYDSEDDSIKFLLRVTTTGANPTKVSSSRLHLDLWLFVVAWIGVFEWFCHAQGKLRISMQAQSSFYTELVCLLLNRLGIKK